LNSSFAQRLGRLFDRLAFSHIVPQLGNRISLKEPSRRILTRHGRDNGLREKLLLKLGERRVEIFVDSDQTTPIAIALVRVGKISSSAL
jgi:hypothetical protein